ncbi:MAG: GtrA family protein [Candidatus Magasanikbacteria bacterium]|nr:GtrA family protein [Candidatus Magasanikbacteria bacterium]
MRQRAIFVKNWLLEERIRIARYLLSGFSAVGVDWGTYLICTRLFHLEEFRANILSVLGGALFAFLANKYWSFQQHAQTIRQTRRFFVLSIFNYLFQQYGFFIAIRNFHIFDLLAKAILIGIMVCWNFLIYKYWVYAVK